MTDKKQGPLALDHNGQIPVTTEYKRYDQDASLRLTLGMETINSRFLMGKNGHFRTGGFRLLVDGNEEKLQVINDKAGKELRLNANIPLGAQRLTLQMYDAPLIDFDVVNGELVPDAATAHHRLTVSELRQLATSEVPLPGVPADRALWKGFDAKKHAPITDVHTHSSAQISAESFIKLGLDHDMDYPAELLAKLNITLNDSELAAIKHNGSGLKFDPMASEGLACEIAGKQCDVIPLKALTQEHRDTLMRQLRVPQDAALCFSDFDREMYRYLNPLAKNPKLTKDIIHEIAKSYKANGVRYAELSTGAMLEVDGDGKAAWFRGMVEAVDEVEKTDGVRLRFLAGIPRKFPPHKVLAQLEKIKYAVRHPYIVGVDMLGYESNKTKDFSWALAHIADWARTPQGMGKDLDPDHGWDFRRDFVIRVHAGETGKNSGNVAEAVRIAKRYGVRVRVAHAVNEPESAELDQRIHALATQKDPLVAFEFCPDSNVAYNNIQELDEVPYKRWLACCPNSFLGTDGAGSVQTTPTQLALSALSGGLKLKDLEHIRAFEESYIADEKIRNGQKTNAFQQRYGATMAEANAAFFEGFEKHLAKVKRNTEKVNPFNPPLPGRYKDKVAIGIFGAGGESWSKMDVRSREQAVHAMRMLVASLDAQKVYFVVGRTKDEGITHALDEAVMLHNEAHPKNKFKLMSPNTAQTSEIAQSIDWLVEQPGDIEQVPSNIAQFMSKREPKGISIFIGGTNFTGDMISQMQRDENAHYLLMDNAEGASKKFSKRVRENRKFNDSFSLVERVAETLGELHEDRTVFRKGVDPFDRPSMQALQAKMLQDSTPRTTIEQAGTELTRPPQEVQLDPPLVPGK